MKAPMDFRPGWYERAEAVDTKAMDDTEMTLRMPAEACTELGAHDDYEGALLEGAAASVLFAVCVAVIFVGALMAVFA